ncbi:MAG: heme-binding domain-containing protein [Acidobacteria bacterium]|nr:heme-binding domain-containing protein [Acidobacteriota bacterium]
MATGPGLRLLAKAVLLLAILFVGIQFVRPPLPHPPVTSEVDVPPEVKAILKSACYNCHSNETKLSWFDQPAPAYWLVARDVKQARARLNFSEMGKLPKGQQNAALFESVAQIEQGAMPLVPYQKLHPEARITPEQLQVLKAYLRRAAGNPATGPAEQAAADAQYAKWVQGGAPPVVSPAPNGIAFPADYKNWQAISSTERFDNHTLRQILGNDIAVRAIAENRIHPWPDGAVLAKVAWLELNDGAGNVRPGQFFQVEFMVRDSQKYASTLGWGWARWRGADLKPYGKDAAFTTECVGCHRPLEATNYVFTAPIGGQP